MSLAGLALETWTLNNLSLIPRKSMSLKKAVILQGDSWIQMMFSGPISRQVNVPTVTVKGIDLNTKATLNFHQQIRENNDLLWAH